MESITTTKEAVVSAGVLKPEWLRPKDVPKIFGVGRSRIYELIAEGKVKSVSLRQRGQKHGTRLISYDSLAAYLESLVEAVQPAPEGDASGKA